MSRYISQSDVAARWGITTNAVGIRRKRHPETFPIPLPGGRPRYKLSDIEHYEKHGTRPTGRVLFGKSHAARIA